jgi:hypothetical protein
MANNAADAVATMPDPPDEERVILPADLGFAAARELHARLLAVADRPAVLIEAGAVERMSTAAVLVLVSFLTPPAAVEGASGAFVDTFSELGLFASLMRMEFRS